MTRPIDQIENLVREIEMKTAQAKERAEIRSRAIRKIRMAHGFGTVVIAGNGTLRSIELESDEIRYRGEQAVGRAILTRLSMPS